MIFILTLIPFIGIFMGGGMPILILSFQHLYGAAYKCRCVGLVNQHVLVKVVIQISFVCLFTSMLKVKVVLTGNIIRVQKP